jgi:hypothetical protein
LGISARLKNNVGSFPFWKGYLGTEQDNQGLGLLPGIPLCFVMATTAVRQELLQDIAVFNIFFLYCR